MTGRSGRQGRRPLSDAEPASPSRDAADALTFPVAGLLADPPGTSREYEVGPAWVDAGEDVALADPVAGRLRLARTNRGLLVHADLHTTLATECSRCLRDIQVPLELTVDEEALPSVELATGVPVDTSAEPDVARLNDHHELELLPLVQEAIWLAEPIAPVCRDDCPGLCATCGRPLDEGDHDHGPAEIDPRFEALRGFAVDADGETD